MQTGRKRTAQDEELVEFEKETKPDEALQQIENEEDENEGES